MNRYWASFWQPEEISSAFEYHGPWWISGEDMEGRRSICAAVVAKDESAAIEVLRKAHDRDRRPAILDMRFLTPKPGNWSPFAKDGKGRFMRAKWMKWPWPERPSAALTSV